jgi:hypothetical protein
VVTPGFSLTHLQTKHKFFSNFHITGDIKIAPPPKKVEMFGDFLLWGRSLLELVN